MPEPSIYGYTGPAATVLRNGRTVAPGSPIEADEFEPAREAVEADEENGIEAAPAVTAERDFYESEGWLEPLDGDGAAPSEEPLAGEALKARAQELDIEGRTAMNADELRAAVAEAEARDGGQ